MNLSNTNINIYEVPTQSSDTLLEIIRNTDRAVKKITHHPEYSESLRKEFTANIEQESISHSDIMENGSPDDDETCRHQNHRKRVECMRDAADFGLSLLEKTNNRLTHELMLGVVQRIEPELYNGVGEYRQDGYTRISTSRVALPNARKVPDFMEQLICKFNESQEHVIERAAILHADFIYIHPFPDGNGRTARMIYNLILKRAGYPAAIIPFQEKPLYCSLLENANLEKETQIATGKNDGYSRCQNVLYEYFSTKTLNSAQRILEELNKKRHYQLHNVRFEKKHDKTGMLALKKHVTNFFRGTQRTGTARIQKGYDKIEVIGDISSHELYTVASSTNYVNDFDIKIIF